jgi:hypothetical protein
MANLAPTMASMRKPGYNFRAGFELGPARLGKSARQQGLGCRTGSLARVGSIGTWRRRATGCGRSILVLVAWRTISMLPIPFKHASFKAGAGAVTALALVAAISQSANAQRAQGPFTHLAGTWSGAGTITTTNGTRERIRCQAIYAVSDGGHGVVQNLRCASDSYKFFVASEVREEGGRISGSWAETTRGVNGSLAGQATDSVIQGTVNGAGFTAGLSLVTRGSTQSVSIRPNGAADIIEVAVSLKRG